MVAQLKTATDVALPPLALRPKVLEHVLNRLRHNGPSSSTLLADLAIALRILVAQPTPTTNIFPLTVVLYLNNQQQKLPLPILLYTTLAFPHHPLGALWDAQLDRQPALEDDIRSEVIPGLVSRLQLAPSLATLHGAAHTLLLLSRSSESLLALMLTEADYILPALRAVYDGLEKPQTGAEKELARAKMDVLALCMALLGAVQSENVKGGLRKLMRGEESRATQGGLFAMTLGGAVAALETGPVDDEARKVMTAIRDDQARDDPRVQSVLALFPALPPHLLLVALQHPHLRPKASGSNKQHFHLQTPEDQAAPLLEAILSGGSTLPADLGQLKRAIDTMSSDQQSGSNAAVPSTAPLIGSANSGPSGSAIPAPTSAPRRHNIHDDIDISKLRLKSTDPESLSFDSIGREMQPGMRENIMRLVQRQAEEAEEAARAMAEARGEKYVPEWKREEGEDEAYMDEEGEDEAYMDEDAPKKVQGDGEESGEEMEGEVLVQRKKKTGQPVVHSYDPEIQTKLELAYLADPTVFDRDATTRRSAARAKLKERTGMDDSQLEGWKIMLERNPHKEAILARHTFVPQLNVDYVVSRPASEAPSAASRSLRGGNRGRGGRGGGGGGGSRGGSAAGSRAPSEAGSRTDGGRSTGGGNGGRGGGGSGGRGRSEHKGSRGHSNATRTRGHDKKMAKMGAGT